MMPTRRDYQAIYSYLIICICMYAQNNVPIRFVLFRMKYVFDLECLIEEYKNSLSEHGALIAPVIRNGLVLYINQ